MNPFFSGYKTPAEMNLNETIFYISSTFEIKINNIISFKKAQDEKETQQSSVV